MRWAAVLALASMIGCDPSGLVELFNDSDYRLSINIWNQGTQQVHVVMDVRDGDDRWTEDFLLDPGGSAGFDYKSVVRLKIVATRTSDNALIFVDSWDFDELNRHENVFLFP